MRAASAKCDTRAAIVDADDGSRGDAGACATATSDAKDIDNMELSPTKPRRNRRDMSFFDISPRPEWLMKAIRDRPPEVCPEIPNWLCDRSDFELGWWTNYNVTPNSSPTVPRPEELVKAMRDAKASLSALHSSRGDTRALPAPLPDSFDGRIHNHCPDFAWSPEAWSAEDLTNLMTQTAFFAQQSRTTRLQVAAGMTVHLTPTEVFSATSGWWLDMATSGGGAVIVPSWMGYGWEGHPDVRWMEVILKLSYFRGIQRLERTRRDPAGLETTAQLFANTWGYGDRTPGEASFTLKKPLNRIFGTLYNSKYLVYRDSGLEVAILHDEIAAMVRNKQNSLAEFCLWLFPEEVCQHPSIPADRDLQHECYNAYEYDYKDCGIRESLRATESSWEPHEADPTPDFFLKYWGEWRNKLWATNGKRYFESMHEYGRLNRWWCDGGYKKGGPCPSFSELRCDGVSPEPPTPLYLRTALEDFAMAPINYGFPRGYGRYIIDIENGLPVLCIRGIPASELAFRFPYNLAVGLADILCQNRSGDWLFDKYKQRGFRTRRYIREMQSTKL